METEPGAQDRASQPLDTPEPPAPEPAPPSIPPAPPGAPEPAPDTPVTGPEPGELPDHPQAHLPAHRGQANQPLPERYVGQSYVTRDGHLVRQR